MHAMVGEVEIDTSRADEAHELLQTFTVPTAKSQPGFISGTWVRKLDGTRGRSILLFESEETARACAEIAAQGPPPGAPVKVVSMEVYEVMAQA
jgi:hypothetical protein